MPFIDACFAVLAACPTKAEGFVYEYMALHNANHGEALSNEVLNKRWVTFLREDRRKIGGPMVSSESQVTIM